MQSIILLSDEKKQVEEFLKKNFTDENIIIYLYPEKSEYSIDQIRNLKKEVKYFNQKKRIYVFYEFDHSSLEAQNAFLKIFEEPPKNVTFILTTKNIYSIITTITSRAKIVNLKNQFKNLDLIDKNIDNFISKFKSGSLNFINIKNTEEAKKTIMSIILIFKNRLLNEPRYFVILKKAVKYLFLLEKNNLNPQTTLDNLLIFIHKCYNENINE